MIVLVVFAALSHGLWVASPGTRLPAVVLVTGDSIAEALDQDLAQRLIARGTSVYSDTNQASAISAQANNPMNLIGIDWVTHAAHQAKLYPRNTTVVMFIGVNEGYSIDGVACCTGTWAKLYTARVSSVIRSYRAVDDRVYWLTLPAFASPAFRVRAEIVNAAVKSAAKSFGNTVRILDVGPDLTPGFVYTDSKTVDGRSTRIWDHDMIHLNVVGSNLVADDVLKALGTPALDVVK
ncbi:MAG TPA: hypothetical protein VFR49_10570 [Solirubrobacteraceae bacterium]|nr:hypothetical protein [Solirubrobacteraceae bacterium]